MVIHHSSNGVEVSTSARSHHPLIVFLATLAAACALALAGVTPASGDANEGQPGSPRANQSLISAGSGHTCAVLSAEVWCWGTNTSGQLGNGSTLNSNKPVRVTGLSGAVAVAAGFNHTCALINDGTARCWGSGFAGQLGNGGFVNSSVPVTVTGLSGATAISAGRLHTCAIVMGAARCWGDNGIGQLGNGTTTPSATPVNVVGLSTTVTAISLGWGHTCAVLIDGSGRCWGINDFGQHGSGATGSPSTTPVPVFGLGGANALTSGDEHNCVLVGGTPRCWGLNSAGQLGNGTTSSSPSSTSVVGLGFAIAISGGGEHTCALPGDGSVRCWGFGGGGQLGNGSTATSTTPVVVTGVGSFPMAVTAGGNHTCAILTTKEIRCWGANFAGQLGNGTNVNSSVPVSTVRLPGAPTGVQARPDFASATVSFTPPADNGNTEVTGYRVVSSPGGVVATGATSPITVSGLSNSTTYTFTVQAITPVGTGPASAASNAVTPSNVPFLEVLDASVVEGNSASKLATFTVRRFGNTSGTSTVKYATANGTAVAPGDYTAKALTSLSFSAGQTLKTVSITVKGELAVEPDETFLVNLSAPVGASIFDSSGTGTIVNDDSSAPPTFTVSDVTLTEANSATTNAVFTITRNGSAAASATVKYKTTDGTAVAPGDYTAKALTSLSFLAGQTSKTVAIAVKGDLAGEPDEFFTLDLSAPTGASIADGTGVATILNNDSTGTTTVSVNDVSIAEGDSLTKTLVFTIVRTGDVSGSSSVKYATANGTAVAPGDYTAKALTLLSFTAGQTSKTVSISIKGDTVVETDELFSLLLSAPVGTVIGDGSGTGTIVNDD